MSVYTPLANSLKREGETLQSARERGIPFVSVVGLAEPVVLPNDERLKKIPGLISVHILKTADSYVRIAYWVDHAHFAAFGDLLSDQLSQERLAEYGFLTELWRQRQSFWRRISVKSTILGLAALFGAVSAIRDYFADLLVAPDISVQFADSNNLDFAEQSQLVIPFTITNQARFGKTTVEPKKAWLQNDGLRNFYENLQFDVSRVPALAPGQSFQGKIYGSTPRLTGPGNIPESFRLALDVKAASGIFRFPRSFRAPPKVLRIWRAVGWTPPSLVQVGRTVSRYEARLYSGKSFGNGLEGEAVVFGSDAIKSFDMDIPGIKDKRLYVAPSQGRVTAKISFATAPLEKFQSYPVVITVEAKRPISRQAWEEISRNVQLVFQ